MSGRLKLPSIKAQVKVTNMSGIANVYYLLLMDDPNHTVQQEDTLSKKSAMRSRYVGSPRHTIQASRIDASTICHGRCGDWSWGLG